MPEPMTCQIGVAPRFRYGDTRDINQPAEPYCFTHQSYVSDGVCDKARIADLEAALAAIASRDIPRPNADWAEVEYAAGVCEKLGIAYQAKWDQD